MTDSSTLTARTGSTAASSALAALGLRSEDLFLGGGPVHQATLFWTPTCRRALNCSSPAPNTPHWCVWARPRPSRLRRRFAASGPIGRFRRIGDLRLGDEITDAAALDLTFAARNDGGGLRALPPARFYRSPSRY